MIQTTTQRTLPFRPPTATGVVVVIAVILVGLVAMGFARRAIDPLDGVLTRRACAVVGDEVSRPVESVQASNRFAVTNRTEGWCWFGPVDVELAAERADELADDAVVELSPGAEILAAADPTGEVQLTVPQIEPGGLYRAGKWMLLLLQLGAASFAIRLVAEPIKSTGALVDRLLGSRAA